MEINDEEEAAQIDSKTNGETAIPMDLDESLTNRKHTKIMTDEPVVSSTSIGGNASNSSLISLNETPCSIIDIPDSTPDVSCELVASCETPRMRDIAGPPPRHSDIYITDVYKVEHTDNTSSHSTDKVSCDSVSLFQQVREVTGEFLEPSQLLPPPPNDESPMYESSKVTAGHMQLVVRVEYAVSQSTVGGGTVGELIRLSCSHGDSAIAHSESTGGLGDALSSGGISDLWVQPAPPPVTNRHHARFSHASSTSSGSSIASSASALALANRLAGTGGSLQKQLAPPLSHERISELRDKWINSREVWRLLDYVDRCLVDDKQQKQRTPPPPHLLKPLQQIDEVPTPSSSTSSSTPRRAPKIKFAIQQDLEPELQQLTAPRKKQRRAATTATAARTTVITPARANGHAHHVAVPMQVHTPVAAMQALTPAAVVQDSTPAVQVAPSEAATAAASSCYNCGDCVFAKWKIDRKFYAATLVERSADGRWTVDFYDGDRRAVSEDNMLLAGVPAMIGQQVYAAHCDEDFTVGIVTGCDKDAGGRLRFSVARDDRDICVPVDQILLSENQVRQVRSRSAKTTGSAKSVMPVTGGSGLRATRSRTRALTRDSPVPGSSGTQQRRAAGRREAAAAAAAMCSAATGSDSEDDSTVDGCGGGTCNGLDPYAYVPGLEPEAAAAYDGCGRIKGKTVAGKMRFGTGIREDAAALGPLPPVGCLPFKGLHMLLSCVRPSPADMTTSSCGASDTSSSTCSIFNENYRFSATPCVKLRLREQLEAGGAVVYSRFEDLPQRFYKHAYIVSNRPSRSARYVMCIAAGVRAVCHQWVIRCCEKGCLLPPQDLPCGWSIELGRFVELVERPVGSSRPLRRKLVLVATGTDSTFATYWTRVLELAEANARPLATAADTELARALCVLCECGYRDERTDRAVHRGVPLVTTVWLMQTLVHGELRDFLRLPCYRPDYLDSD